MTDDGEDLSDDFDPVVALAGPLMKKVLNEVALRRQQEDGQEGFFRDYADGCAGQAINGPTLTRDKQNAREAVQRTQQAGNRVTWRHQLEEATLRVIATGDAEDLRSDLIVTAAICVAWVEAIDRRKDERRIERKRRLRWHQRLRNWLLRKLGRRF